MQENDRVSLPRVNVGHMGVQYGTALILICQIQCRSGSILPCGQPA
jgi:hypothetical protein